MKQTDSIDLKKESEQSTTMETIVLPFRKVILDVILLMCVGFPILFIFLWGKPFNRGFFCDDEDLKHPYHESTVPSLYLYIFGIGLNSLIMMTIEWLNPPPENVEIFFLGFKIPNKIYNIYNVLLVFAFGMLCSQLTTDVLKYSVGRLRPHFYNVCLPDVCQGSNNDQKFFVNFHCTNDRYMDNKRIMKEMRLSFPSGHSSFSIYTMLYFAIYLQRRVTWKGSDLLKHVLQFLAILAALYTAISRISDYKHHWSDVVGGLAIGATTACLTALFTSNLCDRTGVKCQKKGEVTEMRGLNGNQAVV